MQTFTVLPLASRQGGLQLNRGTPVQVPAGLQWWRLQADIHAADYQDTANSLALLVEVSEDQVTWREDSSFTWNGGPVTSPSGAVNPPPMIGGDGADIVGLWVRASLTVPVRMRCGITLTVEP